MIHVYSFRQVWHCAAMVQLVIGDHKLFLYVFLCRENLKVEKSKKQSVVFPSKSRSQKNGKKKLQVAPLIEEIG